MQEKQELIFWCYDFRKADFRNTDLRKERNLDSILDPKTNKREREYERMLYKRLISQFSRQPPMKIGVELRQETTNNKTDQREKSNKCWLMLIRSILDAIICTRILSLQLGVSRRCDSLAERSRECVRFTNWAGIIFHLSKLWQLISFNVECECYSLITTNNLTRLIVSVFL